MDNQALIATINTEMELDLPDHASFEEMRLRLQAAVGYLINKDFQRMVQVLYRVDVNERKLKYLLQENVGADATVIIADLIIERQMEKIESRKQFGASADDISEDEKW